MSFIFPDPPPIFPTLKPGLPTKMKPTFATAVQTRVSGFEARSARQAYPLWEFEVPFEVLRDRTQNAVIDSYYANFTELQKISALFLMCRGQYGRFWYEAPRDNSRTSQSIGTADGVTSKYRIFRTWGTGAQAFIEPVGAVNESLPIHIYLDGVEDTFNWSVADNNINFVRSSPPTAGALITADFFFYYSCRFTEDLQDFEMFYNDLWTLKACKFRSTKP